MLQSPILNSMHTNPSGVFAELAALDSESFLLMYRLIRQVLTGLRYKTKSLDTTEHHHHGDHFTTTILFHSHTVHFTPSGRSSHQVSSHQACSSRVRPDGIRGSTCRRKLTSNRTVGATPDCSYDQCGLYRSDTRAAGTGQRNVTIVRELGRHCIHTGPSAILGLSHSRV